jgi:F-type H+-transporting ATPase subunit a
MAKYFITSILLICSFLFSSPVSMAQETAEPASEAQATEEKEDLDVKEVIFHHLGDGYGWEVPFSHVYRIPLPVIVRAQDGTWHCFSSNRLTEVKEVADAKTGKTKKEAEPVIYSDKSNGKLYQFMLAPEGDNSGKVVELTAVNDAEDVNYKLQADSLSKAQGVSADNVTVSGYLEHDGKLYKEYRPLDISITKNVLALFIASALLVLVVMILVRHYKKPGAKAPRKGMGFFEMLIDFVYTGVIKATLKDKAPKFAPYLLTCFFFILFMNLLGLVVIFPGGANLTGNIAVTLILAIMTFVVTNIFGTKHYWKEIFWPDVPIWLKCPIPIMQIIEVFGMFTKPAALCVRLFANMMGGHMIVITLTVLIFIFGAFGAAAASGIAVVSSLFNIFMLALDVLVSFIQAYVFTMLSTIFISLAQPEHEEHKA